MELFTDFGSMQIFIDVALWMIPVALVLFVVMGIVLNSRRKRMNLVTRQVEEIRKEYTDMADVLEWEKAMDIGVRDLFVWNSIKEGKDGMDGFIHLLGQTGLKIELIPEIEGCKDSIEKSGMDAVEFRKAMTDLMVETKGSLWKNESI